MRKKNSGKKSGKTYTYDNSNSKNSITLFLFHHFGKSPYTFPSLWKVFLYFSYTKKIREKFFEETKNPVTQMPNMKVFRLFPVTLESLPFPHIGLPFYVPWGR